MADAVHTLTISFVGVSAELARETVWTYLLDGGGEDRLLEILEQNAGLSADMSWELDGRTLTFESKPVGS